MDKQQLIIALKKVSNETLATYLGVSTGELDMKLQSMTMQDLSALLGLVSTDNQIQHLG